MSTMTKTIDEIIEQGPYDSEEQERCLDASVRWQDAFPERFSEDRVKAMSDEERSEVGYHWATSPFVTEELQDIPWWIWDWRFKHVKEVTDFEILQVTFEDADEDTIDVYVEVRESDEGFQARLAAEKAARAAA